MERNEISREAYEGDDEDLARAVDAGLAGMAKLEAARRRFDDNPARVRRARRRRAERGGK